MISELTPQSPRWLSVWLAIGSVLAAVILAMLGGKEAAEAFTAVLGSSQLFSRCLASGVVLLMALLLALCAGVGLESLFAGRGRVFLEAVGAVLAFCPVGALTWGLVHEWIVRRGVLLETLMPLELPQSDPAVALHLGRTVWKYAAPALVLAVPLLGTYLTASRLPMRTRALALCLQAPAWLILIEDVLHFMGWGAWMAQSIRAADVSATAAGAAACGALLVAASLLCGLLPAESSKGERRWHSLLWLPWPLWVLMASACGFSQTVIWTAMWGVLFVTSLPAWLEYLRGVDALRQASGVAAWSLGVISQLVVWLAAVAAVHPQPLVGGMMRFFKPLVVMTNTQAAQTLRDPSELLHTGGFLLLLALVLHGLSRLLRWWTPQKD